MNHPYNWLAFFRRLPLDIQRLIFEFDDTYRYKFKISLFAQDVRYNFWHRKSVIHAVRELVYQRLEHLIQTDAFWNPNTGIFYITNGNMLVSKTYRKIHNIRNEVYIFVTPYEHYLRWKLIPSESNLALYDEKQMIYDGCIGNREHNHLKSFHTLFFGDGRMCGNHIQVLNVPEWCKHIGDTYWS